MQNKIICWFRQDLRLSDNPAFYYASKNSNVIPIYILDKNLIKKYKYSSASNWFLHKSLINLSIDLKNNLNLYISDEPYCVLQKIIKKYGVSHVYWNRRYEPENIINDKRLKEKLKKNGTTVNTFNASLIKEPWEIKKADYSHYKIFTPFSIIVDFLTGYKFGKNILCIYKRIS